MIRKNVKKLLFMALSLTTLIICVACKNNNTNPVEDTENVKIIEATEEPCEFINEWDSTLFEVFGFNYLLLPNKAYYPTIEKGRTYLIGQFSTDDLESFKSFFKDVYKIMWGEIKDPLQVMEHKDGVYSFEGEYVVPDVYREPLEDGYDASDRPEKFAYIKLTYDEAERNVKLECKLLQKPTSKKDKETGKEKDSKSES